MKVRERERQSQEREERERGVITKATKALLRVLHAPTHGALYLPNLNRSQSLSHIATPNSDSFQRNETEHFCLKRIEAML